MCVRDVCVRGMCVGGMCMGGCVCGEDTVSYIVFASFNNSIPFKSITHSLGKKSTYSTAIL